MSSERTTTSTSKPYEELLPYYRDLWSGAGDQFKNRQQIQPLAGDRYAGANQTQLDANQAMLGASAHMTGGDQIRGLANQTASGGFLNGTPQLQGALNAAANPITRAYTENIIPQITDQAIASGAYGGARQDLSQEQAARNYSAEALDATNRVAFANYSQERGYQNQAGDLFNQANALQIQPSQTALAAGQNTQNWNQIGKNNDYFKWQNNIDTQNANWSQFKNFGDVLGQGGFGENQKVEPLSILTQIMQALGGIGGLVGAFGGLPLGMSASGTGAPAVAGNQSAVMGTPDAANPGIAAAPLPLAPQVKKPPVNPFFQSYAY